MNTINCLIFNSWIPPDIEERRVRENRSIAADHGSTKITVDAAVKFNPTPPALEGKNETRQRERERERGILQRNKEDSRLRIIIKDFNRIRSLTLTH